MRRLTVGIALTLFGVFALCAGGCRLVMGPTVIGPGPNGELIVQQAPPSAIVEAQPVCPGPGYMWCGGYWGWQGGRHVWTRGEWRVPPRRAARWEAARWERHERGWRFVEGRWR